MTETERSRAPEQGRALLQVNGLSVQFRTRERVVRAVEALDFHVDQGEIVGLVGESGSGKSVTSLALMGLLPKPAGHLTAGSIQFAGRPISQLPAAELAALRGDRLAMVFQDPLTSLNPYLRVEEQLVEVLMFHRRATRAAARKRAVQLLDRVGIPDAERRIRAYPHQLSGGMRQRVCIAMALMCEPDLLIADEPTTMLDVTLQAQILGLLRELRREREMAILFITHDLGVVAELCDRVLVMYAGRIVEQATSEQLFRRPLHPYTEALLASTPRVDLPGGGQLRAIGGLPPRLGAEPLTECAFADRCPRVRPACRDGEPALAPAPDARLRRCIALLEEMESPPSPQRALARPA
ncbi:MAG TPA: ABC transporter ATP-binding protein [Polyangiaceae bacterium]|nr:ABC transporter ATP-binding protein [Polyangiaceae bacterium]